MQAANSRFNIYLDKEDLRFLDSLEGVPPQQLERSRPALPYAWQNALHRQLERLGVVIPGIVLASVLAFAGTALSPLVGQALFPAEGMPVSPILVTIVLGLTFRSAVGLPKAFEAGLKVCIKLLLRIGVALLGLRLSLGAIGSVGLQALPVVIPCITIALVFVTWAAAKVRLPERLACLIAVGTAVCGVSAIVAAAPAIRAEDDEISYSVAVITLFGILALLVYPFLSHWMFAGDARLAGLFLGSAIHDTSQVAGAGLAYQMRYGAPEGLEVATTTKLIRNLSLAGIIPFVGIWGRRFGGGSLSPAAPRWHQLLPLFVIGFLAMASLRTLGDLGERPFGLLDEETWSSFLGMSADASVLCLSLAMASVGLGTDVRQFRRLGYRPLLLGLAAALVVGASSVVLIRFTAYLMGT